MAINFNGQPIDKIIFNGVEIFGGAKPELLWENPVQTDWGRGQNITTDLSKVDFTHDLVYFSATVDSSDRNLHQCICLNGKTITKICGYLNVIGGGWHGRNVTFTSNGWTISDYSDWGGPRILKLWRIKNALGGGVIKSLLYRIKSLFCGVSLCL